MDELDTAVEVSSIGRPPSHARSSTSMIPSNTSTTSNLSAALKRAGCSVKLQKLKNSSNKSKEHMSVASVIVQLIEGMKETSSGDMSAQMNLLFIRQIDAMDRRMEKHDRRDQKDACQERKHKHKHQAMHRAKKKAKKAAMKALESQPDHGGKSGITNDSCDSDSSSICSSSSSSSSCSSSSSSSSSNYSKGSWRMMGGRNNNNDGSEGNNVDLTLN
jgi:hypothetical protein